MFLSVVPRPKVPEYALHQLLWGYFPGLPPGSRRPFVYRVEERRIIVLSRIRPTVPALHITPRITAGRSYQFASLISPMNGYKIKDQRYGRRVIEGNEKRRAWLARRLLGAEVAFCQIYDRPDLNFARPGGERVWVVRCEVVGVLQVVDRAQFIEAMLRGIGGRGCWGHGLLLLPEIMPEVIDGAAARHCSTA